MKTLLCALLAAGCLLGSQDKLAPLPLADSNKLRSAYAEALEKHDAKSRGALITLGKRLAGKHSQEDLVAALRKGPLLDASSTKPRKVDKKVEELSVYGPTTVGYRFECEEGVFRYAVDVPKSYDPKKPTPVLLDPGHGSAKDQSDEAKAGYLEFYRNQCTQAGLSDWLIVRTEIIEQIGAGGTRGESPDDRTARAFEGLWRDLASRWSIDPDRLYVSGLSQTGFWAWYLGRARADRLAGIAPMSAVTWQVDAYLPNFALLPAYVLHGDQDAVCPVAQPRATCAKLEKEGAPVKYAEIAGAAHDFQTWKHLYEGLTWLSDRPRVAYPKKVAKSLQTLADPWCYWLRVEELATEGDGKASTRPTATIEGTIEGQTVRLKSTGVKRAQLFLSRELLDVGKPIEVWWNEKRVFEGQPRTDFALTLEAALEKADWKQTFDWATVLTCP